MGAFMAGDDDETVELTDLYEDPIPVFTDPYAQRAIAFGELAKVAEALSDDSLKDLCRSMLRRLNGTLKEEKQGSITTFPGGKL